ncbi:MAG TPA: SMI1/KNR4 family protein [Gemmataceae bacterium]|nr:SMI1/KNR4 family protein [Gemmataceae bacterium]
MSTIRDLTELVPPPAKPLFADDENSWAAVQKRLGVRLPAEMAHFGRTYGSGRFDGGAGRLQIYNPFDPLYEAVVRSVSDVYLGLREDSPHWLPYDFYPEPGGLFPIAYADGRGTMVFLLMDPATPEKHVVVYDDRWDGIAEYPQRMFDFLFDFLGNRIEEHYFREQIRFVPERHYAPEQ